MAQPAKIRLLIADDQEIVRQGLKALLADSGIQVVAEAATGGTAVKCAAEKGLTADDISIHGNIHRGRHAVACNVFPDRGEGGSS